MSNEVLTALIASGVAIIGAITSFILNWLKQKQYRLICLPSKRY